MEWLHIVIIILGSAGLALLMTQERGPCAWLHRFRYWCGVREYTRPDGESYVEAPTELAKLAACPRCQVVWWATVASASYTFLKMEWIVWIMVPFVAYLIITTKE